MAWEPARGREGDDVYPVVHEHAVHKRDEGAGPQRAMASKRPVEVGRGAPGDSSQRETHRVRRGLDPLHVAPRCGVRRIPEDGRQGGLWCGLWEAYEPCAAQPCARPLSVSLRPPGLETNGLALHVAPLQQLLAEAHRYVDPRHMPTASRIQRCRGIGQ
jgi:hypothetical protein